ncbi:MAG TPA: gephyrin-like molybdotransferase Glp [Verrucomicrobiae bacterium]
MLELEAAQQQILACIRPLPAETILLSVAAGRVLAGPITSAVPVPLFDNAAMDGYAVLATDVAAARAEAPVRLLRRGQVAAGELFAGRVEPGTCVRVFTGSPLPDGADAVVMQEDTRVEPGQPDVVWLLDAVKPWENIRLRGEDVKPGATLGESGDLLSIGRLSLFAATGVKEVRASRRPLIGLLATGSELLEAGEHTAPGKLFESNRVMLAALLEQAGALPRVFPLVKDTLAATRDALGQAFQECDSVVTTGGVSVGALDFVKSAFEEIGGRMEFWKVSIRPGKPFVFGRLGEKFLFGLPGNPVSALVTFLLLVRPAIRRWQGATDVSLPSHPGQLAERLANPADRRHFMRVRVDPEGQVRSAGTQASHLLSSLAAAQGLVDVPPNTTLAAGAAVRVLRWDWPQPRPL